MFKGQSKLVSALVAGAILSIAPAPPGATLLLPSAGQANAQNFGGIAGQFLQGLNNLNQNNNRNNNRNNKRNQPRKGGAVRQNNNDLGAAILQGVGAVGLGVAASGLIQGKAGPVVVGTIMATAPVVFKHEVERKYGREQSWAGCVNCNQKRVLVKPGSQVSKSQRTQAETRVRNDVMDVQRALGQLGFYSQKVDGDFGPGTRRAVSQFQETLGDKSTGKLTAQQRRELFVRANAGGFTPEFAAARASLGPAAAGAAAGAAAATALVTPIQAEAAPAPTIREFRLAQSQVGQFASEILQTGPLSSVRSVTLLGDGLIEVTVASNESTDSVTTLRGGVEELTITPHTLSDLWMHISMHDAATGRDVPLNTVDTFKSADEAATWREAAQQRLGLLKKLTERDSGEEPATIVASALDAPEPAQIEPAQVEPVEVEPVEAQVVEAEPAEALPPVQVAAAPDAVVETPTVSDTAPGAVFSPATAAAAPRACGSDIYVSFNFPATDTPINHYNVTPPEGTLMVDNGDSTAYFTGPCVQGKYDYKYVVVVHDESKKKWNSLVREGSFEIASLAGQCEVNLNDPNGSATLQCF